MKRILFVCTGNTCRSPMAECMMRALLTERGLADEVQALSAGTYAVSGAPASVGAQRAMQRRGLTLADHKSRAVTAALLESYDLIVGLSDGHIAQLRMMYPHCPTPMRAFDDPPVSDPYGGDDDAYERAACDIQRQLPALLAQLPEHGHARRAEKTGTVCRPLGVDELTRELFAAFDRRQEVTFCRRRVGLGWRMIHDPFVDDWTEEQLLHQIRNLQTTLMCGGAVFGAFADGVLKGFAAVDGRPMGPGGVYRDLLSLHVSADCRGRGMGRMLFGSAAQWARQAGAKKLYISAHSAQETQAFYAAMGCVDTQWSSPEHMALEPLDCQLEYTL